ncbi:MAG: hypothetical protein ACREQ5_13105, partial [Candidatus Dormibacteria bacterium]
FKGFNLPKTESLEAMVTPNINGVSTSKVNQSKPRLKWSEREKASTDFRKGRITRDQLTQIDALYSKAASENRIDYEK